MLGGHPKREKKEFLQIILEQYWMYLDLCLACISVSELKIYKID